jgi:transketolase
MNAAAAEADWAARYAGSTRDAYRRTLLELAEKDSRIFCLDSDTGGLEEGFGAALPGQYVNLGIAEANMMTVAAALAQSGKIPFVNTMASFASSRACEQVKLDIAYNDLPVKIVASHGGISGGYLGPTHHALEDVAILRAFPNFTIIVPADTVETVRAVAAALALRGPAYIRLGRKSTPLVYQAEYAFSVGRAVTLRPGDDVTLIAAGSYPVLYALEAHERLRAAGVAARVINMHTLKPLDVAAVVAAAQETRGLVTVEEHNIIGGLGSAVAEAACEHAPAPLRRVGIEDRFCDRVGGHEDLLAAYGVTPERICAAALGLLRARSPDPTD